LIRFDAAMTERVWCLEMNVMPRYSNSSNKVGYVMCENKGVFKNWVKPVNFNGWGIAELK